MSPDAALDEVPSPQLFKIAVRPFIKPARKVGIDFVPVWVWVADWFLLDR